MNQIRPFIVVLDDEPQFCKALSRLLKTHGFDVATFTTGAWFLLAYKLRPQLRPPDCLLLDLHMPDLNGFEILEHVSKRRVPTLVITGHDQPGNAERVRALGCLGYFLKPINELELIEAIHSALARPAPQ